MRALIKLENASLTFIRENMVIEKIVFRFYCAKNKILKEVQESIFKFRECAIDFSHQYYPRKVFLQKLATKFMTVLLVVRAFFAKRSTI